MLVNQLGIPDSSTQVWLVLDPDTPETEVRAIAVTLPANPETQEVTFGMGLFNTDCFLVGAKELAKLFKVDPDSIFFKTRTESAEVIMRCFFPFYFVIPANGQDTHIYGHPNVNPSNSSHICWGSNTAPTGKEAIEKTFDVFANHTCMASPLNGPIGAAPFRMPQAIQLFTSDENGEIHSAHIDMNQQPKEIKVQFYSRWKAHRAKAFNLADGKPPSSRRIFSYRSPEIPNGSYSTADLRCYGNFFASNTQRLSHAIKDIPELKQAYDVLAQERHIANAYSLGIPPTF